MMKQFVLWALTICFPLLVSQGCLSRSDFTVISNREVNLGKMVLEEENNRGPTQGQHCHYTFLVFTIGEPSDLEKALDTALLAKRANVLVDAIVRWRFVWIPLIYTQECWLAEGVAYVAPK